MNPATPVPPGGEHATPQGEPTASYLDSSEEWEGEGETQDRGAAGDRLATQSPPADYAPTTAPPEPEPRAERPAGLTAPTGGQGPTFTRRRGRGSVVGAARSVQFRKTDNGPDVLNFRVDQYDSAGNRRNPVGVEVPSYQSGQISDGDEVEVNGTWHEGTLRAERVINRTTGAQIKGASRRLMWTVAVIAILFFLGWFIFLIYLGITQH